MVRSYNRHEPVSVFGLISSNTAVRPVLSGDGKRAYVPALEDVLVWDVRRGELLSVWHELGATAHVTALAASPTDPTLFAAGYADGAIRLWDAHDGAPRLTFSGHQGAVTTLTWDPSGMRLASAGNDTTVVLWDVVAESGIVRLHGHKAPVTDLAFLPPLAAVGTQPHTQPQPAALSNLDSSSGQQARLLVSVAKDGLLKVWDTELQHAIETLAPGEEELWSVAVASAQSLPQADLADDAAVLVTGGTEGQAKVWQVTLLDEGSAAAGSASHTPVGAQEAVQLPSVSLELQGTLPSTSSKRIAQVSFVPAPPGPHPKMRQLAVLASDRTVATYTFRSVGDMRKKLARRAKRAAEKGSGSGQGENAKSVLAWMDLVEPGEVLRPQGGRVRAFAFASRPGASDAKVSSTSHPILFALHDNALEVHRLNGKMKEATDEGSLLYTLDLPGHRAEVRTLSLSHNGQLLVSACSAGLVKVWNVASGQSLRTMMGSYALCAAWLPDDSHVVVGGKDGTLRTFHVASGNEVEVIDAHDGKPVWSISERPDGQGLLTAGADQCAKAWSFSYEPDSDDESEAGEPHSNVGPHPLRLVHEKTLKMKEDILASCYSPDGRLLALALLDSTVKIFFADSFKFFLSLYGHKLPVLSLSISGDSKLIATASADKSVKLWGLDFGDCHRSLPAHAGSVMGVQFEGGEQGGGLQGGRQGASHRLFTIGKDALVKYWDGDNGEQVQVLRGHSGDIFALAVSAEGGRTVTAGADRSIRVWEKTDELLFLEEEREKELEEVYQNAGADRAGDEKRAIGELAARDDGGAAAEELPSVEATTVTNAGGESLTAGERLIEAIEVADADTRAQATPFPPPRSAVLLAGLAPGDEPSAARYVFRMVEKISPTQLTDVLLILPFSHVISLFDYIDTWLEKVCARTHAGPCFCCWNSRADLTILMPPRRSGMCRCPPGSCSS